MATLFDILTQGSGPETQGVAASTSSILPLVFGLIILCIVGVFVYLGINALKRRVAYEGKGIGPYSISWWGKWTIEANVAVNESFVEDNLQMIHDQSELKDDVKSIMQAIKEKRLYVYNLKITDEGEASDDFGKKVRVITADNWKDPDFFFEDQKGKFGVTSLLPQKEKRRNIWLSSDSKRIKVIDEDDQEVEYWMAVTWGDSQSKKVVGFNNEEFGIPQHRVYLNQMLNFKGVCEANEFATNFAVALEQNSFLKKENVKYKEMYQNEHEEKMAMNMKLNKVRHFLTQKKYVDVGTEIIKSQTQNIVLAILGIFLSAAVYEVFNTNFAFSGAGWVGVLIVAAVFGLGAKLLTEKNVDKTRDYEVPQ